MRSVLGLGRLRAVFSLVRRTFDSGGGRVRFESYPVIRVGWRRCIVESSWTLDRGFCVVSG
uniref:Uncharacterized protein n=1 Tax=Pseudomonas phage vB_PaeM_PE1 TaxID=3161145 RepID=A0AAU8EHK8_9CAUD